MTRQTQIRPEQSPTPVDHIFTVRPDGEIPQDLTQESFVDYEAQALIAEFREQLGRSAGSDRGLTTLLNSVRSRTIREYLLDALLTAEPKMFSEPEVRVACFEALLPYGSDPDVMLTAAQELGCHGQCRQTCQAAYELISAGDLPSSEKARKVVTQVADRVQPNTVDYTPGQEYSLKALGRFPTKQPDEYERIELHARDHFLRDMSSSWCLDKLLVLDDPRAASFLSDIAEGKVQADSSPTQKLLHVILRRESSIPNKEYISKATCRLAQLLPNERAEKIVLDAARAEAHYINSTSTGWQRYLLMNDRRGTPVIQSLVESKNPRAASILAKLIEDRHHGVKAIALAAASSIENPSDELRKAITKAYPSILTKICNLAEGHVFYSMAERRSSCIKSLFDTGLPNIVPVLLLGSIPGIIVSALYHNYFAKVPSDAADFQVFLATAISLAALPTLNSLSHLLPLRRNKELGFQGPALLYLANNLSSERARKIVLRHSEDNRVIETLVKSGTPEAQSILTQLIKNSSEAYRCSALTAVTQIKNPIPELLEAVNESKRDVSSRVTEIAIKTSRAFEARVATA